jgi:hypothetical protein
MVLDRPINGATFQACVGQVLVPEPKPGGHKRSGVRTLIEAAGAELLYLPPQIPDFTPIENACAKLGTIFAKETRAKAVVADLSGGESG